MINSFNKSSKNSIGRFICTCCVLLPVIAVGQSANAVAIEAFGISSQQFSNIPSDQSVTTSICYIDQYSAQLANINTAVKQFAAKKVNNSLNEDAQQQILSSPTISGEFIQQHKKQLRQLTHNFSCRYDAKLLEIDRVPAIVFGKRYVVYGETDIGKAYQNYKDFLDRQKADHGGNDASS